MLLDPSNFLKPDATRIERLALAAVVHDNYIAHRVHICINAMV